MNARIGETSVTPFTNPRGSHGFRLRSCSVTGVGACLPERVLTNAELEKKLGKADGWILTRTGIRECGKQKYHAERKEEKTAHKGVGNAGVRHPGAFVLQTDQVAN